MKFDPQSFFIGIIDFFSVLLPGALLSYFLFDYYPCTILHFSDTESWAIFLIASYLLGHFIFILGAGPLDKYVYDQFRESTYNRQIKELAKGESLNPKFMRWLARIFAADYVDEALKSAGDIKNFYLGQLLASSSVNTFQWSKSRLDLEAPSAFSIVQGFEAHSKFFRSLVVVLLLLIVLYSIEEAPKQDWPRNTLIWVSGILGILFALWRYVDQRDKATRQAYWSIITLEASLEKGFRQRSTYRSDGFTHAGGLVYKKIRNEIQFLLIRPKESQEVWVLPKGHIDIGESIAETAVRELREETGIWARIAKETAYADTKFKPRDNMDTVNVRFYLMKFLEEAKEGRKKKLKIENREHKWIPLAHCTEADLTRAIIDHALIIPQETRRVISQLITQIPNIKD